MGVGHAHALYVHEHSAMHRLAPEIKILAVVLYVIAVAITPREAIWAFVVYAVGIGVLIVASRIPISFVMIRLAAVAPFVLFALMLPIIGTGPTMEIAGFNLSTAGLWSMWNIVAKATIGASASIVLTATTEVPEIVKGLGRLRVPPILTAIASFMIRYLEVVAGELGRMRTAMTARGYDPSWIGQAKPITQSAGALFIRSYERGERIYDAMLARGYAGVMPATKATTATPRSWTLAMSVPAFALGLAAIALALT